MLGLDVCEVINYKTLQPAKPYGWLIHERIKYSKLKTHENNNDERKNDYLRCGGSFNCVTIRYGTLFQLEQVAHEEPER